KANRNWDAMVQAMITGEGTLQLATPDNSGPVAFLLGHMGPDADNERAAETARLFLGIQIQCAQCHDHPSDIWKRTQFHELAASFQAENYDTKSLFREILNSETYQRQIRLGDSAEQHLRFAAAYPTRLRPDALWQSLASVLGAAKERSPQAVNPRAQMVGGG